MIETIIVSITEEVKGNINENEIKVPTNWQESKESYIKAVYGYNLIANANYLNQGKYKSEILKNGIKDMNNIIRLYSKAGFKLVDIIKNPYSLNLEYYFQNI